MTVEHNEELEIDLFEIIRAVLKNKVIIFLCVIIGVLIGGIYAFISPKVYEISTVIIPPHDSENKTIVVPKEIASVINRGILIPKLIEKMQLDRGIYEKALKQIKAEAEHGEYIYVFYRSSDVIVAEKILSALVGLLEEQYSIYTNPLREEIKSSILERNSELVLIKNEKVKLDSDIQDLRQKLKDVEITGNSRIKMLEDKKQFLQKQLDRLAHKENMLTSYKKEIMSFSVSLPTKKEFEHLPSSQPAESKDVFDFAWLVMTSNQSELYNNLLKCILELDYTRKELITIHNELNNINEQIIQLKATNEAKLSEIQAKIAKLKIMQEQDLPAKQRSKEAEISQLHSKLNVVKNVRIIIPPSYLDIPVKPKKKLILVLAFMFSFFIGISVAIFKERKNISSFQKEN